MKKYDILCLEWGTKNRDSNIVVPVLVYLEKEKGCTVKRSSIAYGVLKLAIYRPKMLVVPNYLGAPENTRVVKYAYRLGIKTVSLISEGDVVDDPVRAEGFFWGWDFEKKCYLDLFLLWSERSKSIFEKYIPESKQFNIKVSGATGFDRYRLLKNTYLTKQIFCNKYKKKYDKVIGITSWAFSRWFAELTDSEQRDFYIKSCLELRKILKEVICHFKDVLFVLRPHPGEVSNENEFLGLENLKNVIVIQGKDEAISDNINVCDIWMAYESTTCLEAWLLDKTTILINPFPIEYSRSVIHKGSPIMRDKDEVIAAIEEFYQQGKMEAFECLEKERERIVYDVIGYSDGKSYIRAAQEIVKVMSGGNKHNRKITIDMLGELLKDVVKWICHRSFLKRLNLFGMDASYYQNFSGEESEEEKKVYYTAIYGKEHK